MARGIIVVHGIGEQRRGDFLTGFVDPLVSYLESRGGKVDLEPEIALGLPQNGSGPVTLKVFGPDGRFADEWRVAEAHWAAAFRPPKLGEVFEWGKRLTRQQIEATNRLFSNLTNEGPRDNCEEARRKVPRRTSAEKPRSTARPLPSGTEEFFRNQAFAFKLVAHGLELAAPVLLTLVWALLQLRRLPGLPQGLRRWHWAASLASGVVKAVNALANALYPVLVLYLGDVKVLLDSPIAADAMRRSLEDLLLAFLRDDGIDSITIVAHSLGASVCYDALTEGRPVDRFLQENSDFRYRPDAQGSRRINWVTVGAALNRTYFMTRVGASAHAMERFQSPLAESVRKPEDAFFWLNLYARYDPVPAGPIAADLWQATGVTCPQFKERVVINRDSLLSDHNSYFSNAVLVWPRIVRAICDGEYPWRETELTEERNQELIRKHTVETAVRYRRRDIHLAPLLAFAVLLLAVVVPFSLLLGWAVRALRKLYLAVSYVLFYFPLRQLLRLARRLSTGR